MATAVRTAPLLTGRRLPRERVTAMQRQKILAATVGELDASGCEQATVARIISRARVSRSAFYEQFGDRDECVVAVLDEAAEAVRRQLARAGVARLPWRERVPVALSAVLRHLDSHPSLARVCIVEALRCGPAALSRRMELLEMLARQLDEGRRESGYGGCCTATTAEGLVGAVFSMVHARLASGDSRPLVELAPDLSRMLLMPYARHPAA